MYDLFIIHAARHVSLDMQGWGILPGRMQSEEATEICMAGEYSRARDACPRRSYYATTYYKPDGWLLIDHKAEIRVGSVGVAGLSGGERGWLDTARPVGRCSSPAGLPPAAASSPPLPPHPSAAAAAAALRRAAGRRGGKDGREREMGRSWGAWGRA